jgi:signal transduction histidine kinase/ligand-binding sensor domain-containing protein/DNA-binding response OmpR family regulator
MLYHTINSKERITPHQTGLGTEAAVLLLNSPLIFIRPFRVVLAMLRHYILAVVRTTYGCFAKALTTITCYILVILLVAVSTFMHAEDDIYFSKIGIEQGLSQLSVMTIYQDELGYMWFGTREGISRYNGSSMEYIKPVLNDSNSLKSSLIKNICGDNNGLVFIHNQNAVNAYNMRTGSLSLIQRQDVNAIIYGTDRLWIAEDKTIHYWKEGSKTHYIDMDDLKSPIRTLLQTSDQRLIVGTLSSGVYVIDQNKKYRQLIPDCSQVSSLFEDDKKNTWVGTWQKGLFKIERNGTIRNFQHQHNDPQSLSSNFVRAICQDNKNNLWVGTRRGLERMNIEAGTFHHYQSGGTPTLELSNESVWALFKDQQGTIWAGTYFGGVNFFNPDIDFYAFHNLSQGVFLNKPFPIISEIIEDKNGQLILCTEGDGLILYNPGTKKYKNIRSSSNTGDFRNALGTEFSSLSVSPTHHYLKGSGLSSDNIKTGYYDANEHILWLGTHLGGITRVDLNTYQTEQYPVIKENWEQSDIVRTITPYNDNLLIATYNGLFLLNKKTRKIQLFSEKLHQHVSYFVDIKIRNNELWIASSGLFRYNFETEEITSYFSDTGSKSDISNDNIMKLLVDSKNRLWIATNGGGVNLYIPETDSFQHYNSQNAGLKNDYISNLMESTFGYLFIATTLGLTILDPENNTTYNYASENGFPLNSLYNGGMCTLKSGEIYIAGMNGMVSFNEENLSTPQRDFGLNLVNLWINNTLVSPGDETKVLASKLPYTRSIKLNHRQSMLTIEFAANNYITFNTPLYRYRLEGLSDNWIELPASINKLNFMNLNPGSYRLHLQALSPVNKEIIANTYLEMQLSPPFYRAWYAYLLYGALLIVLVWRYIVFTRSKLLLKTSLEYEKKQKEHIEEVNQSKLRFFTNISHEFRTPLTLISGQVDMLMQMSNVQPTVFNRILNIKRNTLNMQNLIDELLEFRKSEQGHLSIKAQQRDIVEFLYEVYLSFSEYANYRNIHFEFQNAGQHIKLWFDPAQLQKAFYNLISNAFKYTPKQGSIGLSVTETAGEVIVEITDSGIGIAPEAIEKIFDRFYQAENGLQINNMAPGTGIGLALTKNIIKAHSATIKVVSTQEVGTKFIVTFKKGNTHFAPDQLSNDEANEESCIACMQELDSEFMAEMKDSQVQNNEPLHSMLIVEDNDELREMLRQVFEPLYTVYTAIDGEEGLSMTLNHQPDLVLSDLMMPRMSGSELCSKIKNNFLVCHIPVVLLTAQTAVEYNIEGLRLGADDYITKPFNVKTLITRCNNLVNNRRILQEKFSKQTDSSPRLVATNQLDRKFLEKAQQVVEEHLDDGEFDVPAFSREMALGRTKLFTKIKGITGQTPNDFIINVKLKKAAGWLTNNPEYNISDITYMLGFSSPKYFSKCFKEQFGLSPSAYKKGYGKDEDIEEEEGDEV